MLTNWKQVGQPTSTPYNDGVRFAQGEGGGDLDGGQGGRRSERDRSNDKCHRCGKIGHHAWEKKCDDLKHKIEAMLETDTKNDHDSDHGDTDYDIAFCMEDERTVNTTDRKLLSQDGGVMDKVRTGSFNNRAHVIPQGSVGLESMSSVDVFGERSLLTSIHRARNYIRLVFNAGTIVVTQVGTFPGYGEVWYHPEAIANILSLSNVQKRFRVTFDSDHRNQFVVYRPDGTRRVFRPTEKGLYTSAVNSVSAVTNAGEQVAMASTVEEIKTSYTRREVKRAEAARRLMAIICRPSENKMYNILDQRQLSKCCINSQDVKNPRKIFGPDVVPLKGKTVRRKEAHVELISRPIPADLMQRNLEVTVCFDVMYLNGIAFLISISRALKFCTAEALENRKGDTLLTGIKRIKMIYARRGFLANRALGDNEFSHLETGLSGMGMALNTVARDKHVPEVERHIRTLKERCRATYKSLPFRRMPSRLIFELVYSMTFWLHAFPARDGVSSSISPRELVSGVAIDATRHCVIPFGSYAQTHEQHDNSMTSRTIGALALRPTGNTQGGHHFFSLQTGRRIVRNRWTEVPMPMDVIERVNNMAENNFSNKLIFGDRENNERSDSETVDQPDDSVDESNGSWVADSDSDSIQDGESNAANGDVRVGVDSAHDEDSEADDTHDSQDQAHVFDTKEELNESPNYGVGKYDSLKQETVVQESDDEVGGGTNHGLQETETGEKYDSTDTRVQPLKNENEEVVQADSTETIPNKTVDKPNAESADITGVSVEKDMDRRYAIRSRKYNLRPRRKPKYDISLLAQLEKDVIAPTFCVSKLEELDTSLEALFNVLLTQDGVRKGIKLFGQGGDDAVRTEMQQLCDHEVMEPKSEAALSREDRSNALKYLMFLKQKRDGSINGRGCADGRKQRGHVVVKEKSSPTISTEAVLLVA